MKLWGLRVLRKIGLLKRLRLESSLILNNQKFKIPILNELGMNNLMMDEYWMLDLFKNIGPQDQDILLDVGANVGQTLLKWKSVNPASRCISIEPLPTCYNYLVDLKNLNNIQNLDIIEAALVDSQGKRNLNLHFDEASDRTASLYSPEFPVIKSVEVSGLTLDILVNNLRLNPKRIKVIKLDVEGAELEILKSIGTFINDHKPAIILEILASSEAYINDINETIHSLNANFYRVVKKNMMLDRLEKIDKIEFPVAIEESDYFIQFSETV